MTVGPQQTVLYPVASRVLAAVIIAICVLIEVSLLVSARWDVALRATPAVMLVGAGAFVLFWMPRVELSPADLRIVNPLRTRRISWPAIVDIETRWSLTIDTAGGRVTAWAAPAPGPASQLGRMRRDAYNRVSINDRGVSRGNELARSLVVRQWEAYRDEGVLGAVEGAGVTTSWNWPAVAVVGALTVATLTGALWP
ncbi:PH domain-containing protein [Lysinimonas soli]|uniref:PH domain-containing protein n=1 Tax=Lysinimonas soli TaxID=1074233 RepID=A0ABW0NK78_9MICO